MNLRAMFARHPCAPQLEIPNFLAQGEIAFT